mmetsp:Transcript_55737/g.158267  ORF Transcript_55737/g.158267 Transcript_55737/m.158267 type:complete len:242 (+) Transcript_55737:363-1088(+)
MSRSTPFSTSWMGSGGIFRARISLRWSGLMLPTALAAASMMGWISASSRSMLAFSAVFFSCSAAVFCSSCSTSCLRSAERCMAAVMRVSASAASFCFSSRTFCLATASSCSRSTVWLTSCSFCRPFCRCVDWPPEAAMADSYMDLHVCSSVTKCLGLAPLGSCDSWMCSRSGVRGAFLFSAMSPSCAFVMMDLLRSDHSSSQSTVVHEKSAGFAAQKGRKWGCEASMESTMRSRSRTCEMK